MSLKSPSPDQLLERASRLLERGEVIAFKTDTIPGVATLESFSKKLFVLKNRPFEKPIVLFYPDLMEVKRSYVVSEGFEKYLRQYWPGGLTFVLVKKSGLKKIAVRIPDDSFIHQLLRKIKEPLAVTSANKSGEEQILSMVEIKKKFKTQIALFIDQRENSLEQASTVVDLTQEKPVVLRQGAVKFVA